MSAAQAAALRKVLAMSDTEFEASGLLVFQMLISIGIGLVTFSASAKSQEIRAALSDLQLEGLREVARLSLMLVDIFPDAPMPEVAVILRDRGFFDGYRDIDRIPLDVIYQLRGAINND